MSTYFLSVLLPLLLTVGCWPGASGRQKYIVDVLAVFDKALLDKWIKSPGAGSKEKVITEINSLFYEVNFMYQSLRQYNLYIEVRLEDILFTNVSIIPADAVSKGVVYERRVEKFFARWLNQNKIRRYDHAMFFTHYRLKGNGPVNGVSSTWAACKRNGWSRVHSRRDYGTVRTAAHELAHSLGARHDNKKKCGSGQIMFPGGYTTSSRRWYFSKCTANSIKSFIRSLGKGKRNCLLRSNNKPLVSKRMGELMSPNNFCKRLYGNRVSGKSGGAKICKILKCTNGKWTYGYVTPEGIKCGKRNRCFMGSCIYTGN